MMPTNIYFLQRETDYGPFFSTKEKVYEYLVGEGEYEEDEIVEIMEGRNS